MDRAEWRPATTSMRLSWTRRPVQPEREPKLMPERPRRDLLRPVFGLAQTAWIDDSVTPPAQTRAAKVCVRAGHHAPQSGSNHTVLPLGTGLAAGLPKRTRYVVA